MIDLGMTLVWLAIQVSLVLAPGVILYALAVRRGPAAAASVAALCLGLVVALTIAAIVPEVGPGWRMAAGRPADRSSSMPNAASAEEPIVTAGDAPGRPAGGRWPLAEWRVAWSRFERGAADPASRCRPWAGGLAILLVGGVAIGLLRLAMGLGAVVACRRRGRPIDDPGMIGLLDGLRDAIGCRRAVELREIADLAGPATAGWRRAVILLPEDWRSWDDHERRAVLAHELAHVVRGDYAAGLVARLAVALNGYHPIVWWMAGQLRLQQELAADAIGAVQAGGRAGYLVALSRLALRQDGRSPFWPARAFLPARGTLIRRITMLRDENRGGTFDRPWSRARRLATTACLLGVTAAVMMLRGPVRGGDGVATAPAGSPVIITNAPSLPPLYAFPGMQGMLVVRPAAAARHPAIARLVPLIDDLLCFDLSDVPRQLGVDRERPGFLKLRIEDVEWIAMPIKFVRTKDKQGEPLHNFMVSFPVVRTVAPFDWLKFLRQWRFEFTEVREGKGVYYRMAGPLAEALGPKPSAVYLPDDRTIVAASEDLIRKEVRGETPPLPDYVRGAEWERACRGLVAYAIDNRGDALAKDYDMGRPDDAVVLSLLKGVNHWIFSVADADVIALRGAAAVPGGAGNAIGRTLESLVKQGRDLIEKAVPEVKPGTPDELEIRICRNLINHVHVEHDDRSIGVQAAGFGTLADFASIMEEATRIGSKLGERKEGSAAAKR